MGNSDAKLYDAVNWRMLDFIRPEDRRVLDVGCGTGGAVAALRDRGFEAVGVTISPEEAAFAQSYGLDVRVGDIASPLGFEPCSFDAILASHVLEHLVDPGAALKHLTPLLKAGGRFLIALPNIAYWRPRLQLARGRFPQEDFGHFDRTHLRFFTFRSARAMIEDAGLVVERHEAWGRRPSGLAKRLVAGALRGRQTVEPGTGEHPGMKNAPKGRSFVRVRAWAIRLQRAFVRVAPNFLGYEIVIVASPRPGAPIKREASPCV